MDKFSDRLKKALELKKMTAAELSRRLNVDEGTISNYKKVAMNRNKEDLSKLAKFLMFQFRG